jgi:hypothetical protein
MRAPSASGMRSLMVETGPAAVALLPQVEAGGVEKVRLTLDARGTLASSAGQGPALRTARSALPTDVPEMQAQPSARLLMSRQAALRSE